MILGLEDFNGHVERRIKGFEGVHVGYGIGEKILREEECSSFAMKRSSAWQTHDLKRSSIEKQQNVRVEMKQRLIARFQERVKDLVYAPDILVWNNFRNGILKDYDEECGKKKRKRNYVDTCSEEVKKAIRK